MKSAIEREPRPRAGVCFRAIQPRGSHLGARNGKVLSLRSWRIVLPAAVLLAVCAAYANHFQNDFHFDDAHTVVDNPYIRSLRNVPRFFTDATTFSVLPPNRTYRPFVSTSLAIDYALGDGYNPFWFHLSTFLVFLLQLGAIYALYAGILNAARSDPGAQSSNQLIALLSMAGYGLHPAMAETVNYIIERETSFVRPCGSGVGHVRAAAAVEKDGALRPSFRVRASQQASGRGTSTAALSLHRDV